MVGAAAPVRTDGIEKMHERFSFGSEGWLNVRLDTANRGKAKQDALDERNQRC